MFCTYSARLDLAKNLIFFAKYFKLNKALLPPKNSKVFKIFITSNL